MKRHIASPATIRCAAAWAFVALLGIFGCGRSAKQNSSEAGAATPRAPDVVPDLVSAAHCTVFTAMKEHFHLSLSRKDDDRPAPYTSEADALHGEVRHRLHFTAAKDNSMGSVHNEGSLTKQ
jgi:hypothetical protein